MPPKKKAGKKGKSVLTRGRTTKQKKEEEAVATVTSETDDNASERQTSPERETDNQSSVRDEASPQIILPPSPKVKTVAAVKKIFKEQEIKEPWEDLPNLTDELRVGDGNITYITNTKEHREFELDARKDLLLQRFELENLKMSFDASLRAMRNFCPDVKKGKLSDVIRSLGYPPATTLKDVIVRLASLPSPQPPHQVPKVKVQEPIFEESETELDEELTDVNSGKNHLQSSAKKFPSPAKMFKYHTPKQQGPNRVFNFGTQNQGLSTNKAARLPKPGEIMYSEGGSPILQRRIPDNHQPHERVEILHPDGTKYEVDMVYRGAQDVNKLRGFQEFARDVRGIAASRATSVKQNRVQPPKIVKGTQSASKSKPKPGWR